MSRKFDDTSVFKEGKKDATVQCRQKDFDPGKQHTAQATVANRTLTITATIGEKKYQRVIADVDVQEAVKVKTQMYIVDEMGVEEMGINRVAYMLLVTHLNSFSPDKNPEKQNIYVTVTKEKEFSMATKL